ncbi:MAG: histidinol dehydrogenase [Bacteroidia bacterium]|nr:histidinol dehydrogenase [Bacteroidia bacterium]
MLTYLKNPGEGDLHALFKRAAASLADIGEQVNDILEQVETQGDMALHAFSQKYDKVSLSGFEIDPTEISKAEKQLPEALCQAMRLAAANISAFHKAQAEAQREIETMPGVRCWRKSIAIERVGLYIPGGSAPLFSTLLMLGIPAQLAGCKEVILCTPPGQNGEVHPAILFAAHLTGIKRIFRVGGAQAIAAMAFGTESIPKVDKLFGPGNAWVTLAKQLVSAKGVAIDLPAGPSELAILADETANASFVAADLLSQAEHGPDSQVLLVSNSELLIEEVMAALELQLKDLPRKAIARKALAHSFVLLVENLHEGMELINRYAPEHLIINCKNEDELVTLVQNAGSVFLGQFSPESAGDYASGTNHTLPTMGFARSYSGVSLDSFVKKITFQRISAHGLQNIGPAVEQMAEAEGLSAHRNAVSIRLKQIEK